MRWTVLMLLFFYSMGASASPRYYMGLDAGKGSSLWLDHKVIEGVNVYSIGHKNYRGQSIQRALPKEEYNKLVGEMSNWMKDKDGRRLSLPGAMCNESVYYEAKRNQRFICLDDAHKKDKVRFLKWYDKTVRLALGMF